MALSAIAWLVIMVVVILSLTFAPNWSLAILILVGKILRVVKIKRQLTEGPPFPIVSPDFNDGAGADVDHDSDSNSSQRIAILTSPTRNQENQGVPADPTPQTSPTLDSARDAWAIAVDVTTGDTPVDAPSPAWAVDAAGKPRRKRELSSTSSSSLEVKSEVFLNFSDTDAPKKITGGLDRRLKSIGIFVLKNKKELRAGEEISQEIIEAIKQSKISIPIFSRDYAFSRKCLSELEQMWMYSETKRQTIIPIFYDVSPSDVEHQTGDFGRAFDLHKTAGVNSNTITKWREVLQKVGKLREYSGKLYEGHEGQLVEEVVFRVARMLRDDGLAVTEKLFGIDLHVEEMIRKLGVAHSKGQATEVRGEDVRFVGICGVPGVGKTTLAKIVFNKMHDLFDACSFLEGIHLKGVQFSEQMLIDDLQLFKSSDEGIKSSKKKVLIVLDDVNYFQLIEVLAGIRYLFDSGSRIIVTTKERHVLKACRIVEEHEVEPMSDDHALQLFRHHAFQGDAPEEVSDPEYDSLSKDIVKAVGRVPGDIVHHASYLRRNMGVDNWRSTLELLQKHGKERQAAL